MHSYYRPRRIKYSLGLCFVAFGGLVRAQDFFPNTQVPQCTSPLTPAPCPLLESVMSTCADIDGESYMLPSVTSQTLGVYTGPVANTSALEQCQCTNVAYNLYAACAACQVGSDISRWLSRENWSAGCIVNSDESQIAVAPARMAPDTISTWMRQIYSPTFTLVQALEAQVNGTPASGTPLATTPTTETVSASNSVKGSHGSGITSSGSTTNNTGIIVGAVVGVFALLAIVALGIIFCIRRRQRRERWSMRSPIIL